jgi:hypothetical protein
LKQDASGFVWPNDVEDNLHEYLDDVIEGYTCDLKKPRVEFKVLVPAE